MTMRLLWLLLAFALGALAMRFVPPLFEPEPARLRGMAAAPEGQNREDSLALARLMRTLNELPKRMRIVFDLSQIQGYTQRDVARVIGTSPTMVNFLLRDTLSHCRARLGEI